MIKREEIKPYLKNIERKHPNIVMNRLKKGSLVQKSFGLKYQIEDPDIDRQLGDFPKGAVPYAAIYKEMEPSMGKILQLFSSNKTIPFSSAFEAKLGQCLEKAILVHLAAQRNRDSFLINGVLGLEDEVGVEPHAFNVVYKDGEPFLVDAQNPLGLDGMGKVSHPYIAPIIGIENGDFLVLDEWKQGRTYSLS
jgi:hypothetical protein